MFQHISPAQLKEKIDENNVSIVDIRDQNSYFDGHISNAELLDNNTVPKFLSQALLEKEKPVVVCCYHGNSSQGAAQYLAEQGLENVYSLDGGFEVWKITFPELVQSNI